MWGVLGEEIYEEVVEDKNDPNYDESEVLDKNTELREVIPEMTAEEFVKRAEPILLEYYEHADTLEAAVCFEEEIGTRHYLRPLVVSLAVETAFDHKQHHCEMTSVLLSDLYGRVVTGPEIVAGLTLVLQNLPDLMLDTPEAPTILGNFIARAVADDCVPPIFVSHPADLAGAAVNEHALLALKRADTLLTMKKGWAHLDNVWGHGGPLRPVKVITKEMNEVLREYVVGRDMKEAERCLVELEVAHFHHEFVYETVVMAIESIRQEVEEVLCGLLKHLYEACIVSPEQMEQAFQRVFDDMADIVIDVPLAYAMLDRIVERCGRAKILSEKTVRGVPARGRKRFVSEGDGGQVKQPVALMRD